MCETGVAMTAVAQGFRVRNIAQNEAIEIENRRRSRLGPVQSAQPYVVVANIKSIWEISACFCWNGITLISKGVDSAIVGSFGGRTWEEPMVLFKFRCIAAVWIACLFCLPATGRGDDPKTEPSPARNSNAPDEPVWPTFSHVSGRVIEFPQGQAVR